MCFIKGRCILDELVLLKPMTVASRKKIKIEEIFFIISLNLMRTVFVSFYFVKCPCVDCKQGLH